MEFNSETLETGVQCVIAAEVSWQDGD